MLNKEICKKCCKEFKGSPNIHSWLPAGWDQYDEDRWNSEKQVWCPANSYAADVKHARSITNMESPCLYKAEQLVLNDAFK